MGGKSMGQAVIHTHTHNKCGLQYYPFNPSTCKRIPVRLMPGLSQSVDWVTLQC